MNYEKIIIEMLSRIQDLEDRVEGLEAIQNVEIQEKSKSKVTTSDIRDYINKLKKQASSEGKQFLELRANEIHRSLNLKSRFPMVCNAMRQCMGDDDEIMHETASGYSSSLKIRYML